MKQLLIVGVGSPFGDDTLGWQALDALQAGGWRPPGFQVTYCKADRPGSALLELFAGRDAAVLLDALVAGGAPGAVRLLDRAELQRHGGRTSSHALGVAEVLALGDRLGLLPAQLWVIGLVPGGPGREPWLAPLQALLAAEFG